MKIIIGSKNPIKVEAVKEVLASYAMFRDAEIISQEIVSQVSDQPKTLEETIEGACARAKNAFSNCDFSFGIESGLMKVPHTKTGYMDHCICAIYDGQELHLGMSSCYEYPPEIIRLVMEEDLNISQAFRVAKLTEHERVGYDLGAVGILTNGRITRKEYTKPAIIHALIHLENKKLYN